MWNAAATRWMPAAAAVLSCGTAHAAPARGGLYCDSNHATRALNIFASRVQPDGRLRFGISKWDGAGHNMTVYGVAIRQGPHWEYRRGMNGPADRRCRIVIRNRGGAWLLDGDPVARCESSGGYGTEIGSVRFTPSHRKGPVRHELDDLETFATKAGIDC